MNTTIDLMLLASVAGVGIFIGLVTVLAIVLILKQRREPSGSSETAPASDAPGSPTALDGGRRRLALAVLITGILLLSLGLPAVMLWLSPSAAPEVVPPTDKAPVTVTAPEPSANLTQPADPGATPQPETPPKSPVEPGPEPEAAPEPAAPDNFVVSNLRLTPDPESGHNWYRVGVTVANTGAEAGTLMLAARVGDRHLTARRVILGGGDNVTLELNSLALEIGFLATMYENGQITQRRHQVVVHDLREELVFEHALRVGDTATGKIEEPDWVILSRDVSDVEATFDGGTITTYRVSWQITLRSNTVPHRVFTITVTFNDASGDIIRRDAFENNELPRWDTRTFRGFVTLTAEEKDRVAGYQISVLCTGGCGEPAD